MTSDDATLAYAREHLEHLRYCLLGLPQIAETALLDDFFGRRADEALELYRKALARRAKR